MSKHVFNLEEFAQEKNINAYYEQEKIRSRAFKYLSAIELNNHFLTELQETCSHPDTTYQGGTNDYETYYDYTCKDCRKTWREYGKGL